MSPVRGHKNVETQSEMEDRHARERAQLAAATAAAEQAEDWRLVAWLRKARPAEHAVLLTACNEAGEVKRVAAAARKAKSRAADVTPAPAGVTSDPPGPQGPVEYAPQTGAWNS